MSIRPKVRTEQINLRVTPTELEEIRSAAERNDTSVTQYIMTATLDKIAKEKRPFIGTLRRMREQGLL